MRKLIGFLLFSFLFVPIYNVSAFTDNIPINKNIVISQLEERYRWYKLEKVNERIESATKNNCEYFEELNNEFTEWSEVNPEEIEYRDIETKEESTLTEYNSVIIKKFKTSGVNIKELILYNSEGEKIEYSVIECRYCDEEYTARDNMKDSDYSTSIRAYSGATIVLKLDKKYTEDINIHIIYDRSDLLFGWQIELRIDYAQIIKSLITNSENLITTYSATTKGLKTSENNIWEYNEDFIKTYYRYKDNLINCYDYEKKYADGYYTDLDGYIKDESSRKTFYKYEIVALNCPENKCEDSIILNDETEDDTLAINYGTKKESKDYSKIPVFIALMGGILILLVLICRKMRLNLKNGR